jgi:hypothetical protein
LHELDISYPVRIVLKYGGGIHYIGKTDTLIKPLTHREKFRNSITPPFFPKAIA